MPGRNNRKRITRPNWSPVHWLSIGLTVGLIVGLSAVTIHWKSGYFSGQAVAARTAQSRGRLERMMQHG